MKFWKKTRNNTYLEKILETFKSYLSIRPMKKVTFDTKFSFQYVQ